MPNVHGGLSPIANQGWQPVGAPGVRKALCEPEAPLRFRKIMDEGPNPALNLCELRALRRQPEPDWRTPSLPPSSTPHTVGRRSRHPRAGLRRVHAFTTTAVVDMPSELREYGWALVLTTQFGSRLDEEVRKAVFENVGTLLTLPGRCR